MFLQMIIMVRDNNMVPISIINQKWIKIEVDHKCKWGWIQIDNKGISPQWMIITNLMIWVLYKIKVFIIIIDNLLSSNLGLIIMTQMNNSIEMLSLILMTKIGYLPINQEFNLEFRPNLRLTMKVKKSLKYMCITLILKLQQTT